MTDILAQFQEFFLVVFGPMISFALAGLLVAAIVVAVIKFVSTPLGDT